MFSLYRSVASRYVQVTVPVRCCTKIPAQGDVNVKEVISPGDLAKIGTTRKRERLFRQDLSDRFSDRQTSIRLKGSLFQVNKRAFVRRHKPLVDAPAPDPLRELKTRALFIEKMLSHLMSSDVKLEMRIRQLPDSHQRTASTTTSRLLQRKPRSDK